MIKRDKAWQSTTKRPDNRNFKKFLSSLGNAIVTGWLRDGQGSRSKRPKILCQSIVLPLFGKSCPTNSPTLCLHSLVILAWNFKIFTSIRFFVYLLWLIFFFWGWFFIVFWRGGGGFVVVPHWHLAGWSGILHYSCCTLTLVLHVCYFCLPIFFSRRSIEWNSNSRTSPFIIRYMRLPQAYTHTHTHTCIYWISTNNQHINNVHYIMYAHCTMLM